MSYLGRYKQGAYEQVWRELMQLGPAVREEPIYSDARVVAQETMRRVRQNIEILMDRLISLGFVFGYDYFLLASLTFSHQKQNYLAYHDMHAWVQKQPPVFLDAHQESRANAFMRIDPFLADWEEKRTALEDEVKSFPLPLVEALENGVGPLPLSIRAWYMEIGAVNFYGYFAPWENLARSLYSPLSPQEITQKNLYL